MGLPPPTKVEGPPPPLEVAYFLPWFYEVVPERDYLLGEAVSLQQHLKERHIRPFYKLLHAKTLMPYEEFLGLIRNIDSCWQKAYFENRLEKQEKTPKPKAPPSKRGR